MSINITENLSGQFTLRRKKADTGEVLQEVGPFSNLITNIGLNRLGTSGNPIAQCYVGTGTVPPTVNDTNMSSFLVATATRVVGSTTAPAAPAWFSSLSFTFEFAAGVISNNITEVGVGWAGNPNNALWSRELIVDSTGNPVAITVLPNEILEVVYTIRQYHNTSDFTGTFVLNGVTYSYTGRIAEIGTQVINYTSPVRPLSMTSCRTGAVTLGPITGTLQGGTAISTGSAGASTVPYVNNSFTIAGNSVFALGTANSPTGISAFYLGMLGTKGFFGTTLQLVLDKAIPKTELNTMTFTWAYSWSRYEPPAP